MACAPASGPSGHEGILAGSAASSGDYLTDEKVLLRIVGTIGGRDGQASVEIEDCRTLDVVLWPLEELAGRQLRLVRAARD